MAQKRMATTTTHTGRTDEADPSKAELQRRMEEARDSITHTVEEIKDTVSDQYKSVKETVADVLNWNENFSKNPLAWGIGAVSLGLVVGYSIAVARQDTPHPASRRKRRDDDSPNTDDFFAGLSRLGMNVVLPAVSHRIKDLFGIDLYEQLLSPAEEEKPRTRKRIAKKSAVKKSAKKKVATKKRGAK